MWLTTIRRREGFSKPENPSTGASLLRDTILNKIKTTESGLVDERVDTIQLSNFTIPSAGLPSDKGCVWNGNFVYSYQTESWSSKSPRS